MIQLIVGLGNPGAQYVGTRHNVGFDCVERLAWRAQLAWQLEKRWQAMVARGRIAEHEIYLMKPQTFMNRSGLAVVILANFYRILPNQILVVHDELGLAPGQVRLKLGGGNNGHNGLRDINAHLKTADYWRLRVGIGHPRDQLSVGAARQKIDVSAYVLSSPDSTAHAAIDAAIEKALSVTTTIVSGDFAEAMMQLHTLEKRI